jgi:hypothetical protein
MRALDASSSGEGDNPIDVPDTGDAPDLMVGVEGGDTGNEAGGVGDRVRERYSDVGGDYKIPRKR